MLGQGTPTYTLATVGRAPQQMVTALRAAGDAGRFTVRFVARSSAEQVQQTLRAGDATVGLAGGTLFVSAQGAGTFRWWWPRPLSASRRRSGWPTRA